MKYFTTARDHELLGLENYRIGFAAFSITSQAAFRFDTIAAFFFRSGFGFQRL